MPPKDFDTWNALKKHIHQKRFLAFVHAREVWWCSLGLSAGSRDAARRLFCDRLARVRLVSIFVGDNGSGFGAGHDFEARIKIDHG